MAGLNVSVLIVAAAMVLDTQALRHGSIVKSNAYGSEQDPPQDAGALDPAASP